MTPCMSESSLSPASAGLDDLAALDAAGADVEPLRGAADEGAHPLHVRVPAALGAPVRVGDRHAPARVLPTDVTYGCHGATSRKVSTTCPECAPRTINGGYQRVLTTDQARSRRTTSELSMTAIVAGDRSRAGSPIRR